MVSYQYTYLILDLILLALWLVLFFYRKDTRKEMLVISLIFGVIAPFFELVHVLDWWKPLTITGTIPGIEDFLFGFGIGGVASVVYEEIYRKRIRINKKNKFTNSNFSYSILLFIILFFGSFYILKISSFYSSVLSFVIPTSVILLKRKDLIKDSIISGFLMLIIGTLIYFFLKIIQPGFIEEFWYLGDVWYAGLFLGIPVEEYIWFFLAGAFIGPLYEYWKEGKLINMNK